MIGKSTGIALLMAAALLAALFAMGVFSATGVGAQAMPTATAALVDENDPATPTDATDDKLVISVMGLSAVGADASNTITVTANAADLGLTGADVMLSWGGGSQFGDEIASATITEADGIYAFTFSGGTSIVAGDATITITTGTDARIDSNTRITGLTIGRGTGATLNTIDIPDGGLAITGAPTGPSISVNPAIGAVPSGDPAMPTHYNVTIAGMNFTPGTIAAAMITARDTSLASGSDTVTLLEADDATDISTDALEDATVGADGTFSKDVEFAAPTNSAATTIEISVTDTGDTAVMAMFYLNTAPTITAIDPDPMEVAHDAGAQDITVEGMDGDNDTLTFTVMSEYESVATAMLDNMANVKVGATTTGTVVVTPVGSGTTMITVTVSDGKQTMDTTFDFTVGPPPAPPSVAASAANAGTATRLTIVSNGSVLGPVGPGDRIVVNLKDFGLPATISTADVTIDDGDRTANPSEVTVSGDNVTIVLGKFASEVLVNNVRTTAGNSHEANVIDGGDAEVTITIRERAGIMTPNKADTYPVKVDGKDANDADGYDIDDKTIMVGQVVTVKPATAVRGTEITITGKGFTDGAAVVKAGNLVIGNPAIMDGAFSLTVNNDMMVGTAMAFPKGPTGTQIQVEDSTGTRDHASDNHVIKAAFSIMPESPNPGQDVTITLKDSDATASSTVMVSFAGGTAMTATDAGDSDVDTWKVTVPSDVRAGIVQMRVTGASAAALTKNVTIATNDLTVTPAEIVPGQQITVTGTGFTSSDKTGTTAEENTIAVGAVTVGGVAANEDILLVDNNGRISFNVNVPAGVVPGSQKVVVTDLGGRVGNGSVTVTKPALSVSPDTGLIGSDFTVSGTGFPANDLVQIKYHGRVQTTAPTGADGSFTRSVVVPSDRNVTPGGSYDVEAVSQIISGVTAKIKHMTPKAAITVSPDTATAGGSIMISGENFTGFLPVSKMEISTRNVTTVPAPVTDSWGAFSQSVLVPQLTPGRYPVRVTVGNDTPTVFLTITDQPVSSDPADVFASIGDRLSRVWFLDAENQEWLFYDPSPDFADFNDLTSVTVGVPYIVIVNEGDPVDFQGNNLFAGTNFHVLR